MDKDNLSTDIDFNFENHWNNAYKKTPITSLGWFEIGRASCRERV